MEAFEDSLCKPVNEVVYGHEAEELRIDDAMAHFLFQPRLHPLDKGRFPVAPRCKENDVHARLCMLNEGILFFCPVTERLVRANGSCEEGVSRAGHGKALRRDYWV
ncbi:hypothetical protein DSM19430T_27540 [Desulfovibrio psychrotolerans]|uniref:Uncharacterized protein n=1 Tax=Desulfovibrio psychrotolerans TaxID=415242 RepID=A0A7J0BWH9_9BACT|nr:hypothetical protein DSM19430T_27540 [Desulfovibrio psychrotolerans]